MPVQAEGLMQNSIERGAQIVAGIEKIQSSSACAGVIGEIRGKGLMLGVEFDPNMPNGVPRPS